MAHPQEAEGEPDPAQQIRFSNPCSRHLPRYLQPWSRVVASGFLLLKPPHTAPPGLFFVSGKAFATLPPRPHGKGGCGRSRTIQGQATRAAPMLISSTPIQLRGLNSSPSTRTPSTATSTTLSLSIGATRDTGPSCSAWK